MRFRRARSSSAALPPSSGELVALVDSLRSGTLNETQVETVRVLRTGLVALAERERQSVPQPAEAAS